MTTSIRQILDKYELLEKVVAKTRTLTVGDVRDPVNAVGAVINYGVYAALVHSGPPPLDDKYAAQFLGVLAGLIFNFTLSRFFVFRAPPPL